MCTTIIQRSLKQAHSGLRCVCRCVCIRVSTCARFPCVRACVRALSVRLLFVLSYIIYSSMLLPLSAAYV